MSVTSSSNTDLDSRKDAKPAKNKKRVVSQHTNTQRNLFASLAPMRESISSGQLWESSVALHTAGMNGYDPRTFIEPAFAD